jgi:carbonic anhydrase/acetyltransferase-like protein (isoleucine patch superfamily)
MAGARVDAGAAVHRSIVGGRSVVGAGSVLSDVAVVGYDQDVPAGTVCSGGSLPPESAWS